MVSFEHTPVMLPQIVDLARGAKRAVDCTVGGGGHSRALLDEGIDVLGIDRDPEALVAARRRLGDATELVDGAFFDEDVLAAVERFEPDFVLLDLGVSSRQFDGDDRGFSFRRDTVLDMRMDPGTEFTAADLLNSSSEDELGKIFREYGDERRARALARQVCTRRVRERFETADHLVRAIRATLGARSGPPDFARIFQAVRIAVNDELGGLERALPQLLRALCPGGVIAVISYHSGEDRIVKHSFAEWSRQCVCPPEVPLCSCRGKPLGQRITRKPVRPDATEMERNVRSRSALLRAFQKASR